MHILTILLIGVPLTIAEGEVKITYNKTPIIIELEPTYPLYDSGRIVDYSRIKLIGKAKVVDKYYCIIQALLDSACDQGVDIKINSGYRSFEDQVNIRRRYARDKHCKEDTAHLLHAPSYEFYPETARPGHSRHHSGIAYDFNTKDPHVYKWLQLNAHKYKFFRTIDNERWHWEYIPNLNDPYYYVNKQHWSWRISYKINRYGKSNKD